MIAPTHVAALSDLADKARLVAVVSRHPDRARPLADLYAGPAPRFTADLSAVTDDPDIDMVIVATPPNVRVELISAVAEAGKHILLEKPVARSLAEAERVVEICEAAGVTLGMLFQHRAQASSRAAANRIAQGGLGQPGLVEISAPLWRDQSYYDALGRGTYERDGGGVLLTQAIHTIDLALSLAGPVTRVQAMTATTPLHRMESEDYAVAGLTFASGAVGSLIASTATFPPGEETIKLHYEAATLRHGRHALDVFWRDGRCERETFGQSDPGEGGPLVAQHDLHRAIIEDFVDALRAQRPPIVTGREALASLRPGCPGRQDTCHRGITDPRRSESSSAPAIPARFGGTPAVPVSRQIPPKATDRTPPIRSDRKRPARAAQFPGPLRGGVPLLLISRLRSAHEQPAPRNLLTVTVTAVPPRIAPAQPWRPGFFGRKKSGGGGG